MQNPTCTSHPSVWRTFSLLIIAGSISCAVAIISNVALAQDDTKKTDQDKTTAPKGEPKKTAPEPVVSARDKARQEFERLKKFDKPLLPVNAEDAFKKFRSEFLKVLKVGTPDEALKKPYKGLEGQLLNSHLDLITEGIKYRVFLFAEKSERKSLDEVADKLILALRNAGRDVEPPKQGLFRDSVMKIVTDHCAALLNNNIYVRLNALYLLARLDVVEASRSKKIIAIPYVGCYRLLLDVLEDPNQHGSLKIAALKGLKKILYSNRDYDLPKDLNPPVNFRQLTDDERHEIVAVLVAELRRPNQLIWYQRRLTEAVGCCQVLRTIGAPSVDVVNELRQVLKDRQRHWIVSAEAAYALSRLPLNASSNADHIIFEINVLQGQMIQTYTQQPSQFFWKGCFGRVYIGFQPRSRYELDRGEGYMTKIKGGPLAGQKQAVTDSFRVSTELMKHLVKQPENGQYSAIPAAVTTLLVELLKTTKPASLSTEQPGPSTSGSLSATKNATTAG